MVAVNWSGYPNGQIPASKMVAVEGFYFEPVTAACVRGFLAAARAAGYRITITQGYRALGKPTDAWNTEPVTQWSAWNAMNQGKPLPGASVVASAAPPGTSTHGDGMSADYTGTGWHPYTPLSTWIAAHAILWGIVFDIVSESWHGHRKYPPRISVAGGGATSIPAPATPVYNHSQGDDDVRIVHSATNPVYPQKWSVGKDTVWQLTPVGAFQLTDLNQAMNLAKVYNPASNPGSPYGVMLDATAEELVGLIEDCEAHKITR